VLGLHFELKTPVVHDFADWRLCIWGYFHQIQTNPFCMCNGVINFDNPDLLAVLTDQSNFGSRDFIVLPIDLLIG